MTQMKTETGKEIKADVVEAIAETEAFVLRARKLGRRAALAYVGVFGMAFDAAAKRFEKVSEGREELMNDLVKRGEKLEKQGLVAANDAKVRVTKLYEDGAERVRGVVPFKGERVEELEAEVEKLSKKVKALNAKATTKTTKTKTVAKKAA